MGLPVQGFVQTIGHLIIETFSRLSPNEIFRGVDVCFGILRRITSQNQAFTFLRWEKIYVLLICKIRWRNFIVIHLKICGLCRV